jgi:hypothetical protein
MAERKTGHDAQVFHEIRDDETDYDKHGDVAKAVTERCVDQRERAQGGGIDGRVERTFELWEQGRQQSRECIDCVNASTLQVEDRSAR